MLRICLQKKNNMKQLISQLEMIKFEKQQLNAKIICREVLGEVLGEVLYEVLGEVFFDVITLYYGL